MWCPLSLVDQALAHRHRHRHRRIHKYAHFHAHTGCIYLYHFFTEQGEGQLKNHPVEIRTYTLRTAGSGVYIYIQTCTVISRQTLINKHTQNFISRCLVLHNVCEGLVEYNADICNHETQSEVRAIVVVVIMA